LFGSIAIVLYIVVVFGIARSVTSPIAELQKEMEKVELLNYSYKKQKAIQGSREVQELDKSFNSMMNRINELANKIVLEQKAQKESELKALQNQINPHFLYNTLDSIIYMINKNESEKAEEMIIALSKFFRISISNGKAIIPIRDEIEHAKNYLLIQKLRCGDSFTYDIDIDPALYDYECVKLILQPIIENAIAHGIKNADDMDGKITIKGGFAGDLIRFDIIDDGFGMTKDKIDDIYKSFRDPNIHTGVGLQNVFLRIKMYYGDLANIIITSELDSGTDISIFITKKDKVGEKNEK
jgi:two-component system, sensor histidine kinase YesM